MITFTPEQQATVDFILEQIQLGPAGKNVVVSGQGGVGKTEMVCELVCILLKMGKRVAVGAMTGKATSVLRGKITKKIYENGMVGEFEKKNLCIETIQRLTKESKVLGISEDGETKYSNTWKDPALFDYDVLIIDELSMVPHYVSQWWQRTRCRVIGLGDFCQLPEVTTGETKKELAGFKHDLHLPEQKFISGYGVKVLKEMSQCQLTKVLRSTNNIALLCNDLRDFSMTKHAAINVMKDWAEKSPNIRYSTSMKDLQTGRDWQIICYTNKKCQEINNMLSIGTEYPNPDDKVLLLDNINPIQRYNGETMIFKDLVAAVGKARKRGAKVYVCFKWQGRMPRKDSPYGLERQSFNNYVEYKADQRKTQMRRMATIPVIIRSSGFAKVQIDEYVEQVEEINKLYPDPSEAFLKVMDYFNANDIDMAKHIADSIEPLPQLYMVSLDFGYAVTTHKSQGSEYPKVCYILERFDRPLLYTGLSRAKDELMIINLTKEG